MRLGKELTKGVIEEPAASEEELPVETELTDAEQARPARPATTARRRRAPVSRDRAATSS
jgi:hypothetical protein